MKSRKDNVNARRKVALNNLEKSKFFPKKDRTPEQWTERKEREIATLKQRIR